jgi:hypothetical protein
MAVYGIYSRALYVHCMTRTLKSSSLTAELPAAEYTASLYKARVLLYPCKRPCLLLGVSDLCCSHCKAHLMHVQVYCMPNVQVSIHTAGCAQLAYSTSALPLYSVKIPLHCCHCALAIDAAAKQV